MITEHHITPRPLATCGTCPHFIRQGGRVVIGNGDGGCTQSPPVVLGGSGGSAVVGYQPTNASMPACQHHPDIAAWLMPIYQRRYDALRSVENQEKLL